MLLIILGAGASFDSDASYPAPRAYDERLPLVGQLFEDRPLFRQAMQRFRQFGPLVPLLRKTNSIETLLDTLQSEAERPATANSQRRQQLAAIRYYLQFMLQCCEAAWISRTDGVTCHLTLLDELWHSWPGHVHIATFNYDRLIENAIERIVNIVPRTIHQYPQLERFRLYKLHGSVHWGRSINFRSGVEPHTDGNKSLRESAEAHESEPIYRAMIANVANVELGRYYYVENDANRLPVFYDGVAHLMFPAVAIPLQTKTSFECPDAHVDELKSILPHVDRCLIVGWRAQEKHFLPLLAGVKEGTVAHVVCESDQSVQETCTNLAAAGVQLSITRFGSGFSSYVLSRQVRELLTSSSSLGE